MKLSGEINGVNIQKTGVKITFMMDNESKEYAMQVLSGFVDKPITLEMLIDAQKVIEDQTRINDEQRSKIFALTKDVANAYGDTPQEMGAMLKQTFCDETGMAMFSRSDCHKDVATEFINWIIEWSYKNDLDITDKPKDYTSQELAAIMAKKCVCCGKDGKVLGNANGKICLCEEHQDEIRIDAEMFLAKYHISLV